MISVVILIIRNNYDSFIFINAFESMQNTNTRIIGTNISQPLIYVPLGDP